MIRARSVLLVMLLAALVSQGSFAAAQSAFALTRVELMFQNGRGDITVPLRYPALQAYAILHFSGTGVFQGAWEVDGRLLSSVIEPVAFGEMLILAAPRIPPLPMFEPGLHRVTLKVTSPKPPFKIPEISYFVTAEEYEEFRKRMEKLQ
jgi:hypothetical protein